MKKSDCMALLLISPLVILTSPIWILREVVHCLSKLEEPLRRVLECIGEVCRVEEFYDWWDGCNSIENQRERERIANEDL